MVSTRPTGERSDEEYALIEEYAVFHHEQLPEMFEWPRGWVYENPLLLHVVMYRHWLRDCKTRARRGNPPVPFIEWMKTEDRRAERKRRSERW